MPSGLVSISAQSAILRASGSESRPIAWRTCPGSPRLAASSAAPSVRASESLSDARYEYWSVWAPPKPGSLASAAVPTATPVAPRAKPALISARRRLNFDATRPPYRLEADYEAQVAGPRLPD